MTPDGGNPEVTIGATGMLAAATAPELARWASAPSSWRATTRGDRLVDALLLGIDPTRTIGGTR
jgi:hypothetical protein